MKSKSLIILMIVVALLVGISYLSFQISGAAQPSTSAKVPAASKKSAIVKAPGIPSGKPKPQAVSRSIVATKPGGLAVSTKDARKDVRHQSGLPAPVVSKSPLLTQGFEEGIMPPTGGWSVIVNNPYTWGIGTYDPYEGSYNAVCYYDQDYTGTQDEWIISPVIDLTTKGSAWHLYFYWMMSYYWAVSPYNNYNLEAWISTDGGITWSTKLWCEDNVGVFSNFTWYKADIDLAPYLTQNNVKLGFRYYGYDGAEADVDYITVDVESIGRCCYGNPQSPSCADVTHSACTGLGGTFTDGLNCTNNPCPVAGPGENCATAIPIPSLPYNTTGNTCGFLNDYDETCPYSGGTAPDVVYSYSPAANQTINIELCNSLYDTKVFVYEDACASGTAIACNDDACGSDGFKSAIYGLSVSAGHTYYIVVDGYGSNCGDYVLSVTAAGAAPPNDECTGAPIINTFPTTENGTTIGATIDCPGVLDWYAVWYQVDLPYALNKLTLDYCPTSDNISQVGIVLYSACPIVDCYAYTFCTNYQWMYYCPNGFYAPQVWWTGLPQGSYWVPIGVWNGSGNPFMDFSVTFSVEELAPPANDNCDQATAIGNVTNLPFSTEAATFDGPGTCQSAPNIWYCYTATCDGDVDVSLCGSSYDTKLAVWDGCTCPPVTLLGCNDDDCGGTLQSDLKIPVVTGHQYLIEVGGFGTSVGSGVLSCSCYVPPPAPANDLCENAIQLNPPVCPDVQTVYGTTIGATNDCPGVFDWPGVWYTFELPYAAGNDLYVDYCPTNLQVGTRTFALLNSCDNCAGWFAGTYSWVTCTSGYTDMQVVWKNLPAGTYHLPVLAEDYSGNNMDFAFNICMKEHVPCVVTCPPHGIPENEPICYDDYEDVSNGGCNSVPPVFNQTVNCHDTICGTSGYYSYYGSGYRDTDWFPIQAAEGDLTFRCVAEFPVQILLINPGPGDCSSGSYSVVAYALADECDTATISYYVTGGTWWLWIGPQGGLSPGPVCGSKYVFWTDCQGFGPQIAVTPTSFDHLLNPTGACSTATENLLISSVGGEDLNWSIAENPPVSWLAESPLSGTLPPGNTATVNVSFNAGGVAPGDYNTNLDITSNAPKGVVTVPVHLKVELPPEIDVAARLWVPVIPGCSMDEALRVNNLGTGDLRFDVVVASSPPPLGAPQGMNHEQIFNQVPNRKVEDFFKSNAHQLNKSNLPKLTTSAPSDISKAANVPSGPTRAPKNKQNVIWDNGGTIAGGNSLSSQLDQVYPFVSQVADDFIFTANMDVTDVHWWGTYWNGTPLDYCDFYIYIYADDGTGNGPTGGGMPDPSPTALATYFFTGLSGLPTDPNGYNEYNVTLSPAFSANANVKYWIAIQAVFAYPPQWGWAQTGGIQLHDAMQGFPLLGNDFWTLDNGVDMAFYLTGEPGFTCPMSVSPGAGTIPPSGHTDLTLAFDGTAFQACGVDTTICYLVFTSNDCDESQVTVPVYMWAARGDVNGDCRIDVLDVVFLLNYIFVGGPAPNPLCVGDVNRSGGIPDSDDALYLISYLFLYGPPPEIPLAPKGNENMGIKTIRPTR